MDFIPFEVRKIHWTSSKWDFVPLLRRMGEEEFDRWYHIILVPCFTL